MRLAIGLAASLFLLSVTAVAEISGAALDTTPAIPSNPIKNCRITDKPNDVGGALTLEWELVPSISAAGYAGEIAIYRSTAAEGPYELAATLPGNALRYEDSGLKDHVCYYYRLIYIEEGIESAAFEAGSGVAAGQWFHTGRIPILILMLLFSATAVFFIKRARSGYTFKVRPIAGINAVDEAIGRATEMGRPILYVPGLGTAADVATIAAFTILARVARKTAEYNTRVIVPNYDPVVMTVCQEVVREAYSAAGKPDLYDPKDVFYVTQDQFPYTAAVNGIILREKTATNFYMGMFYAESLVLAETGFVAGSIQIAGTDQLVQIPFFVCACDFVLMGEELYAASAYLSKEPQQLGTLKAQDWGKVTIAALIIIGTIFATFGWKSFAAWFNVG